MNLKNFPYILLVNLFLYCNYPTIQVYHIYSEDGTQVITVLTRKDTRYIVDGKVTKIPDDDYIRLDLYRLNRMHDADRVDGIGICFWGAEKGWTVNNPDTAIEENKLHKGHEFENEWKLDSLGARTSDREYELGCSDLIVDYGTVSTNKNGVKLKVEHSKVLFW